MNISGWLTEKYGNLADGVKRFRNAEFLDAVVAGCAIVAAADGKITAEEKQKMAGYIGRSTELKVFEIGDAIKRFNHFAEHFEFDAVIGKAEALKVIARFKDKPEQARLVVSVCCAIGAADGDFDDQEKSVVRDICAALTLPPSDFRL